MPAGKPYTPSAYQSQLKKLETKVGRASGMARKKAQDALRAFKRTRPKYYTKNPADRAVRRAGAAVKKTAKKVVRKTKTTAKRAVASAKRTNARAQASGAVNKRRAIEKLETRLKRTNDPFKKREIRKELTAARKAKGNVFAKAGPAKKKVAKKKTAKVDKNYRLKEKVSKAKGIVASSLKKAGRTVSRTGSTLKREAGYAAKEMAMKRKRRAAKIQKEREIFKKMWKAKHGNRK